MIFSKRLQSKINFVRLKVQPLVAVIALRRYLTRNFANHGQQRQFITYAKIYIYYEYLMIKEQF